MLLESIPSKVHLSLRWFDENVFRVSQVKTWITSQMSGSSCNPWNEIAVGREERAKYSSYFVKIPINYFLREVARLSKSDIFKTIDTNGRYNKTSFKYFNLPCLACSTCYKPEPEKIPIRNSCPTYTMSFLTVKPVMFLALGLIILSSQKSYLVKFNHHLMLTTDGNCS